LKERTLAKHAADELRAIAPIAERQMRRWASRLEHEQRPVPTRMLATLPGVVHPYVAISREAGAGGGEIGRLVAERLRCECFDNEILSFMADRYGLPKGLLRLVDETTSNWLNETLRLWLDRRAITQDEYVMHVGQLMVLAASQETAVFVGRGAQFVLPRERGLAVRVVAPFEQRIARTMERQGLDRAAASAHVRTTDEGRASYVRRQFHADLADVRLYDLVVNLEHLDLEAAAAVIATAFHRRFAPESRAA
jgi:cytidylate kinase